jgi:lipopolysaccharide/colanic/teichoic acid biosynthesis glycosyltransferase
MRAYDWVKRVFDIVFATAALVLVTPVAFAVAAAIKMNMGRPVLFRQRRAGRHGKPFQIIKFRTMSMADTGNGAVANLATDGDRLTRLGNWLRSTSLDELPTLWNVLRGEMSVVGPRPLLVEYLDRYTPEQARRHEVRPGITGLTQVRGRNGLSWEEKFAHDVSYVDRRNLGLDLRIVAKTVATVLRRENVSAHGTATALEFVRPRVPATTNDVDAADKGRAGDPVA